MVPKLLMNSLSVELDIDLERFVGLDDNLTVFERDLKISGIAAAHEFLDRDEISGCYPYLGFIVEGNNCTIYHSGDTCIYEGMKTKLHKFDKLDVMFIPINGRDGKRYAIDLIGNMTYQEAVDLAGELRPGLVVPAHYEMFDLNSENPKNFAEYLEIKYPGVQYWIGEHGERVRVVKDSK